MRGRAIAIAVGLAVWKLASALQLGGRQAIAGPLATLAWAGGSLPALLADLSATGARATAGLALGVLSGVALGLAVAASMRVAPALEALLDFARSVPPVILLPVLLLAAGYTELARVGNVAIACAWTMALSVTAASRAPRSARREQLALAGAPREVALAWTEPWESLPLLAMGLRSSASIAVIVAVVTEMVAGAERGLGARVVDAQIGANAPALTASVLAAGGLGYALNTLSAQLEAWARRRLS